MELIRLTQENLEKEHICCAISNNKDIQVMSKKNWLKDRIDEGLVFLKANVRGKCFIEYIPAEYAWAPVEAEGYMYIDCLWVSGQLKGHGYSNLLLEACMEDSRAKGKKGLVIQCRNWIYTISAVPPAPEKAAWLKSSRRNTVYITLK